MSVKESTKWEEEDEVFIVRLIYRGIAVNVSGPELKKT